MEVLHRSLSTNELEKRARNIRLVLTDCDGVLTDNGVYYGESGEVMKRFSIRDGMGVERLRNAGIQTAILTGERSLSVVKRAEKLRLENVFLGVSDKKGHLRTILEKTGVEMSEMAYMGDDVNDLELLHAIGECGLTAAPQDAMPEIQNIVHYKTKVPGGHGAFRDFAEWILKYRQQDG